MDNLPVLVPKKKGPPFRAMKGEENKEVGESVSVAPGAQSFFAPFFCSLFWLPTKSPHTKKMRGRSRGSRDSSEGASFQFAR